MNYVPSGITSTILYGVPAFCLVYFGGDFATKALAAIPQNIIDALNVVGALMPALGIAMLLSFLAKKRSLHFSSLDTSQLYMPNWTQWQSQSCSMRWCLNLLIHNEERRRGGINNGRRKERTGKITEKRFGKTLVVRIFQ